MRARRLTVVFGVAVAWLLFAGSASAQGLSDRQIRQRLTWAIAQIEARMRADTLELGHLLLLRDSIHARIVRDSLRADSAIVVPDPIPGDTVTPPDTAAPPVVDSASVRATYSVVDRSATEHRLRVAVAASGAGGSVTYTAQGGGLTPSRQPTLTRALLAGGVDDAVWYVPVGAPSRLIVNVGPAADTIDYDPGAAVPVDSLPPPVIDSTPPPPDSLPVPPPGTYSPTSPHWPHMRVSAIDYSNHYQPDAAHQWDLAAVRLDLTVGGTASEYKARNPSMANAVYDLLWALDAGRRNAMETWLRANGHDVESAYIHNTNGTRKETTIWGTVRNLVNPGHAGVRAYFTQRFAALTNGPADQVFLDEFNTGRMNGAFGTSGAEYSTRAAFFADMQALLRALRQATRGKRVIVNTAEYMTADDRANAEAAGGALLEFVNTPFRPMEPRWQYTESLIRAGVQVQLSTGVANAAKNNATDGITPGLYGSIRERVLMFEYTSYLMALDPARMDPLYFEPHGAGKDVPMSDIWLPAWERDIGQAQGARRVIASGSGYKVFARDFGAALVVCRPKVGSGRQDHGDASAVTVQLPAGSWRLLRADGSTGPAITSIVLRNGEGAVLVP